MPTRQIYREGRSLPRLALHTDLPAVCSGNLSRDVETKPEPAILANGNSALEALENASLILLPDPDTVIADLQLRQFPIARQGDLDGLAGPVFDRIAEEIDDHLLHPHRVPGPPQVWFEVKPERAAGSGQLVGVTFDHAANQLRQVNLFQVQRNIATGDAGGVQEIVYQPSQRRQAIVRLEHEGGQLFSFGDGVEDPAF